MKFSRIKQTARWTVCDFSKKKKKKTRVARFTGRYVGYKLNNGTLLLGIPAETRRRYVHGARARGAGWLHGQDGVIFLMEGVLGDLRRVALFLRDAPRILLALSRPSSLPTPVSVPPYFWLYLPEKLSRRSRGNFEILGFFPNVKRRDIWQYCQIFPESYPTFDVLWMFPPEERDELKILADVGFLLEIERSRKRWISSLINKLEKFSLNNFVRR